MSSPHALEKPLDAPLVLTTINRILVGILLLSGLAHGTLAAISDIPWEDPLSFRKPALFGISTGLTLWSCDWCFRQLSSWKWSTVLRGLLGFSLLAEVGLITLQTWRGEASHFNRVGWVNSTIETIMLVLIVIAMGIILFLTIQSLQGEFLPCVPRSMRIAIRWGLLYLLVSGFIGFAITFIGHRQQLIGKPPEIWGERGALKFPHGAALHAIQTLVVISWFVERVLPRRSEPIVKTFANLHGLMLAIAIYQTFMGRGRFEFDRGTILVGTIGTLCCFIPLVIKNKTDES